jgi:ABC-type nitrate/sulfonate/bicarbonate transport system substrate-binding protein
VVKIDERIARCLRVLAVAAVGLAPFQAGAEETSVVTQLGWLRNGEYAPIMIAEAKGFFKEEGIDHKIVDGGPGKNPIPIVAVGQAQFGLGTNGMALVTARLAKDPVDVVAVGTLFQQAPTAYISIASPGAPPSKPKDMEGKTVGVQTGTEFLFHAFAKKNGLDESKIKLVTAQATVEPLMVGKMDYFLAWVVNQTYQIEQEAAKPDAPATVKGKIWQALKLSDLGIATYTDVIFVASRHAQEKSRVGEALSRGRAEGHAVLHRPSRRVGRDPCQVPGPGRGCEEARLALQDPERALPE